VTICGVIRWKAATASKASSQLLLVAVANAPQEWPARSPRRAANWIGDQFERLPGNAIVLRIGPPPTKQIFPAIANESARSGHLHPTAASVATGRALLVKNADGNARENPLVKIAANAAKDMLRFAGEFGLTPVARARIALGVYAQPTSKFDGLLGG
jgi:Phage terminase, small subunit